MNEAEEIASFRETGKTIIHRGTKYTILNPPEGETRADSPWILRSARGKYFALMRNKPRPELLFGMNLYNGLRLLPGWFTDKSGELESIG